MVSDTKQTALAFFDSRHRGARTKIGYYARKVDLKPQFTESAWFDAMSEAMALVRDGAEDVHLIGHLEDISADVFSDDKTTSEALALVKSKYDRELREAFIHVVETSGIKLHALDLEKFHSPTGDEQACSNTIKKYIASIDTLRKVASVYQRRRWAREGSNEIVLSGRPPYGYAVEDGKLMINEHQAKAVRFIFEQRAKNKGSAELIEALKKKFPYVEPDSKKKQNWDRCKLHRIVKYADLYTNGHYINEKLHAENTIPDLIIVNRNHLNHLTKEFVKNALSRSTL